MESKQLSTASSEQPQTLWNLLQSDDESGVSLPYNGSSGWSGTDTSKDRADHADSSGETKDRQRKVLNMLYFCKGHGATWKDIADRTGWHHGTTSGVLSVLHKDGKIARLTQKRDKCRIYVAPEYVYGRETDEQGRVDRAEAMREACIAALESLPAHATYWVKDGPSGDSVDRARAIDLLRKVKI